MQMSLKSSKLLLRSIPYSYANADTDAMESVSKTITPFPFGGDKGDIIGYKRNSLPTGVVC